MDLNPEVVRTFPDAVVTGRCIDCGVVFSERNSSEGGRGVLARAIVSGSRPVSTAVTWTIEAATGRNTRGIIFLSALSRRPTSAGWIRMMYITHVMHSKSLRSRTLNGGHGRERMDISRSTWLKVLPHTPPRARVTATAKLFQREVKKRTVHCAGRFPLSTTREKFSMSSIVSLPQDGRVSSSQWTALGLCSGWPWVHRGPMFQSIRASR